MNLTTQRRLAASILKVGENRVWIDPNEAEEVSRAITRESVKQLIDQGIIKARPKTGISSYRSKKIKAQKALENGFAGLDVNEHTFDGSPCDEGCGFGGNAIYIDNEDYNLGKVVWQCKDGTVTHDTSQGAWVQTPYS